MPPLGRTIRAAETPAVRLGDSHVPADQEEDASRTHRVGDLLLR